MTLSMPTPVAHTRTADVPQLIRHVKRPDWGCGALLWTRPTKRAYQFEDGRLRLFKKPFYDLLEPVDIHTPDAAALVDQLQERGEARASVKQARRAARKAAPPVDAVASFEEQLGVLLDKWPGGFEDPAWVRAHRHSDGKRLKRHRDPAIQAARVALSPSRLQEHVDAGSPAALRDAWVSVLEGTDLVPPSHRKALAAAEVDAEWMLALADLVHGAEAFEVRFERWIASMPERACTWANATAPLALVHPERHTLVRTTPMRRQLKRVRPDVVLPKRPGAPVYASVEDVMTWLQTRLVEAGQEPRDRLDLADFVRVTCR